MDMQVDCNIIKQHRKKHAWSQSELAHLTGLSLRTVQRIEKSGSASLESVKAFAAVFEVVPESLQLKNVREAEDKQPLSITGSLNTTHKTGVLQLSDQATQLSLAVFLPAVLVMLFMLLTKLPNTDWVHAVRLALFSDSLPMWIASTLNILIGSLPLLLLALSVGIAYDIVKRNSLYYWLKNATRNNLQLPPLWNLFRAKFNRFMFLLKKPALFSLVLLSIVVAFIALTIEPYQKENLKHYIALVLHSESGSDSQ